MVLRRDSSLSLRMTIPPKHPPDMSLRAMQRLALRGNPAFIIFFSNLIANQDRLTSSAMTDFVMILKGMSSRT